MAANDTFEASDGITAGGTPLSADLLRRAIFSLALLLSGLAGISYEILYGRILGNLLGDQFAVSAALLITFLLGIGLGAKYAWRLWPHLWAIEAFIGIYGILFALNTGPIDHLLYHGAALIPGLGGSILFGTLLLLLPALMIGCSVPLFAGYLGRIESGHAFSRVYTVYNVGACLTALLIEFWLIREFGITATVLLFSLINLLVALLLFVTARPVAANPSEHRVERYAIPRRHLASLVVVSMASAIFQLFMVKISEMMFGPFRETFALVLAIVLFGIAFGSLLVRRFRIAYPTLLLCNLVGVALFIGLYDGVLYLYALLYQIAVAHGVAILFLKGAALFLLMGLPAVTFGATIPALIEGEGRAVARESGRLLFISSMANVAGFLLMALVLHRLLDYGVQLLVIAGMVALALALYLLPGSDRRRTLLPAAAAAALVAVAGGLHHWKWDEELLYLSYTSFHSVDEMQNDRATFQFPERFKGYQDVFSINWSDGDPYFFINGYVSFPLNNPSEKMVGAIGSIYAPRAEQALVLGLGSGTTASVVGMLFDHTDVVEINPVVRENQHRMVRWNFDIEHNPRVDIVVDDAIHYTKAVDKDYDLILNTVTSPLYFSSSKLYTREFLEAVKSRLRPDGTYVTWIDSRAGSEGVDIIIRTLQQSFGNCAVMAIKSGYFLLIASDYPIRLHHPELLAQRGQALEGDLMGEHKHIPQWLAYHLMTTDAYALVENSTAPVNTIDRPSLEYTMARIRAQGIADFKERLIRHLDMENVRHAIEPAMVYDPLEHMTQMGLVLGDSNLKDRWEQLARVFVTDYDRRLDEATLKRYRILAERLNSATAYHTLGYQYMKRKRYREALTEFRKALALDPRHDDTSFDIAACYEYLGDIPSALSYFQQEIEHDGADADGWRRLARLHLRQGRAARALAEMERAVQIDGSAPNHYYRGVALDALGREGEAIGDYSKAVALDPDYAEALRALNRHVAKW